MDQPCLQRWPSSTHRRQAARRGHLDLDEKASPKNPRFDVSQVAGCRVPLCRCPAERERRSGFGATAEGEGASPRAGTRLRLPIAGAFDGAGGHPKPGGHVARRDGGLAPSG